MAGHDAGLTADDLPGLFQGADAASLSGQKSFMRTMQLRLILAIVAAACGVASIRVGDARIDLLAVITTLALICLLLTEIYLRAAKPGDLWYDGRALAESVKSMAWRYAVGAAPYGVAADQDGVRRGFVDDIKKLLDEAPTDSIAPSSAPVVTARMAQLRSSPLDVRHAAYLRDRIENQQNWYTGKAVLNRDRAHKSSVALLLIEAVGVLAAILKAMNVVTIDLAGVVAALIAAGVAWGGLRQYSTQARAYTFAAAELSIVHSRLAATGDEAVWEAEAADAEEAVSREHTMWRASRSRAG